MSWPRVPLRCLLLSDPQYGANSQGVVSTGNRPRYVRITDIGGDGRLLAHTRVEAVLDDPAPYLLREGDLLFARSGATVGKTYLYKASHGPCTFAGYLIRFSLNPQLVIPEFVYYFTLSAQFRNWVATKQRTAAQPNINGTEYSSLL